MSTKKKSSSKKKSSKKTGYKQGTINGVRVDDDSRSSGKRGTYSRKKKKQNEYYKLVRMLIFSVIILIMVFVVNAIIQENFTFNGIYYEEPETSEVVEIVSSSSEDEPTERVNLNLVGDLVINLTAGDKFVEPGYSATSDLKGDITSYVEVTGEVDTSKVGSYKLTYTLNYRDISPNLTRVVVVKEKSTGSNSGSGNSSGNNGGTGNSSENGGSGSSNNSGGTVTVSPSTSPSPSVSPSPSPSTTPTVGNITLTLLGDATVYLVEGSSYNDAGAKAVDNNGKDVSSNIKVTGAVNTNVAGTYKITYNITNYDGQVLTVVRNVIVQNMSITLTLDNSNYTNKAVNIKVVANVDQFSNIVLPSGEKVMETTYSYKVTKNGTYEFIVYNKNGSYRKASMVVKNIDTEKPKGRCAITHSDVSTITITASDNTGIASYVYSGDSYTTNVITLNKKIDSGLQINIGFYDLAGNYSNCNCISP